MKQFLLFLLLFSPLKTLYAEPNWVILGQIENGNRISLDVSSIEVVDDQTEKFVGRVVFPQEVNGIKSLLVTMILQCNTRVSEIHTSKFYANNEGVGEPLQSIEYEIPIFVPLDQSSVDERTYQIICSSKNT